MTSKPAWAALLAAALTFGAPGALPTATAQTAPPPAPTTPSPMPPPVRGEAVTEVRIVGIRGTPADSLERVGFDAYADGAYEDAEDAFRDAIAEGSRKSSGAKSRTSLAQLYSNLGWLYYEMGNVSAADSLIRRSLALDQEASGDDALLVARRTTELAMLQQATGNYAAALPLLDEALEIQAERVKKADAREVAFTLHLLARNYHAAGDPKQSESFYRRALAGLDEKATMDQSQWAATMLALSELYHSTHRDKEAREAFDKALKKANDLYAAGGLPNAIVLNPYSVLLRRAEAARAVSDSAAR